MNEPNAGIDAPSFRWPFRRWLEAGVALGSVVLITAFLIPAILTARTTARRTQSGHNLRHLVLGIEMFEETRDLLPAGGQIRPDGSAHYGWFLSIMPFLEASPVYFRITQYDAAWDDPVTHLWTKSDYPLARSPLIGELETVDGWPLIHYAANPDVFYRDSHTKTSEITDLAQCWFLGEVSDHFVPWAYPYNWREPGESTGIEGASFRNPTGTCQFGMADGRVVLVAGSEGVAFLQASAKNVPTVEGRSALEHALSRSVPPRHFSATTAASARTYTVLHSRQDDSTKEGVSVVAYHTMASPNQTILWVHVRSGKEWSREQVLDAVHAGCQWRSDEITHVSLPFLSEASVDALRKLPSLRWIVADTMDDHPATLQSLSHLTTLTNLTIRQTATPALHERLQRALPKCQIAWRPTR